MLTIFGRPHRNGGFCDGLTRRDFLTVGGTILGGALTLPNLLRAEAQTGVKLSNKAIINVFLPGGPPHLDMWDLKPDAPVEVRGEFKPIDTNVPGIRICEHFPRIARMMDKFVFIRSISGSSGDHDAFQCMTGRKRDPQQRRFLAGDGRLGVEGAGAGHAGRAAAPDADVPHGRAPLGLSGRRAVSSGWLMLPSGWWAARTRT